MNQRAPRFVKNPSGYHSHGKTHKEKVYNFAVHIKQFGWTTNWKDDADSGILSATCNRDNGGDKITIEWPKDQWWPDVWYHYAGSSLKCRNISQAALIASEKPNADRMRRASSKGKGSIAKRIADAHASSGDNSEAEAANLIESLRTTIPFDNESTPEEVRTWLKNRTNPVLIWINRLSGQIEQDYVKTWSRHLKTTRNRDGKVIIHFVGANTFHAVYVESLIGVS